VARVIGPQTVKSDPTWSWTSLTHVNCNAHIRLQLKRKNQDRIHFTSRGAGDELLFRYPREEKPGKSASSLGTKGPHALMKMFFLYIQNRMSHSMASTQTARESGSTRAELPAMALVKMPTHWPRGTRLENM